MEKSIRWGLLLIALLAGVRCGGGNGGNGNGNGGGTAQTPLACGGTQPDAQAMANWVHHQSAHWAYFAPDDTWRSVESTSSIDISSATGDALVEFAFAYGPLVPTTLADVENLLWQFISNHQVISQSQVVAGGPGQEQAIEFTGVSNLTMHNVHGYIAGVGPQLIQGYLLQANAEIWAGVECTLKLIRAHITYLG